MIITEKTEQLQTQPIPKLIGSLSAPAILSLLANSINMAIDKMFIARGVGTIALSAVTVSFGLYLIIQGFSLLIAAGASASIALNLGKNNKGSAEKIVGNSMTLSILLSVVLMIMGLVFLRPLLTLYGANSENIGFAMEYSTVIISGAVIFVLAQTTNNLLKGMGYAKRAFINFLFSIVVNVILDPLFIFAFGWGVFGAALATVIGNVVCVLLSIQFLCSKKCMANMRAKNMKLEADTVKTIITIGIPACITQLALSFVALTFNHVASSYGGNIAVAAYGIIYSVIMLVYMPVMGLGQGIQPIVGYNYGAKNYERVKQTLEKSMVYVTAFCTLMFLFIEFFSVPIAAMFGGKGNAELITTASYGMRLFSLMLPVVGFQMIGANYFQYIGKFKQSIILSALRQLILLIPLVIILPKFFDMAGIWVATPIADFIAFIVTAMFIRKEINTLSNKTQGELNMQKKGLGMIVAIACGACVVLLTGFSVLGGWGNTLVKEDYQFTSEGLTGILVNSNNSTLTISSSNLVADIQVTIEGRKPDVNNTSVQNDDGMLTVTGSKSQSRSVFITITVPQSSCFNYEATVLSGSITATNLQGKDFALLSNNGDISFSNIQVENIEITADNGMVNFDNVCNGNHYIKSDSGTVIVKNSSGEALFIENDNGTIRGGNLEYKTITPISSNGTVDIQE